MVFFGFLFTLLIGFFVGMIAAVQFPKRINPFVNALFNLFKPNRPNTDDSADSAPKPGASSRSSKKKAAE